MWRKNHEITRLISQKKAASVTVSQSDLQKIKELTRTKIDLTSDLERKENEIERLRKVIVSPPMDSMTVFESGNLPQCSNNVEVVKTLKEKLQDRETEIERLTNSSHASLRSAIEALKTEMDEKNGNACAVQTSLDACEKKITLMRINLEKT